MLALRFGLMDDVFGAYVHASAAVATAAPPQLHEGLAPGRSSEWRGTPMAMKRASGACCSDVFVSSAAMDPATDDGDADASDSTYSCVATASGAYRNDLDDAFDDDFDLGPPPPSGPVLVRQRAMDWTAAREAKAATLAQKLDVHVSTATMLRSTRLIPPSSSSAAAGRSRRFVGA